MAGSRLSPSSRQGKQVVYGVLEPGVAMRRRDFIKAVIGSAAVWPLMARAQQASKVWRMGFIAHGHEGFYDALFEGLGEYGYEEGRNLVVERRYARGRAELFKEFAAEMVRLNVDVVVVVTTPAALAVMNASKTIPIVHPNAIDPLNTGLIDSLARPGRNVTGGAQLTAEASAKRLEILKRVVPGLSRVAGLWNPGNPALVFSWRETQGAARALGLTLQSHEVQGPKEFAAAFAKIAEERSDALLVVQDAVTMQQRNEIIDFAVQKRLPSMFQEKGWALAGGLMSYGENLPSMYRRAAYFVDKIFKDAKPADLPVEQATKFDLVINLSTARRIGLTIPDSVLGLADDVIE
jgi:putative tryptophan/tyrosine transport system substrate-binding protein